MGVAEILNEIMRVRSWKQEDLAEALKTTQANVSRWLKGREPRSDAIEAIRSLARECGLIAESPKERQLIPIMGYVGAGGDVEPDFEQVPYDGLDQVQLDYVVGIVGDPIGFEITGDSNQPKYSAGEIVIVEREQPWATESMIGDFAVVRTYDGHRYLKKIMPGRGRHVFNLVSLNAPTIEGARIEWASPVRIVIPPVGVRKSPTKRRAPAKPIAAARKSSR
jgi:transcriptional regulator with XRE-family HTH domain